MAFFEVNNGEQITSITPSNSSPASLTANNAVKPTASGYAIASYTDIVPSDSDPQHIQGANMFRLQNNLSGYVYETIQSGGGTSIIPSNVAPVRLTADETVTPTLNGYAIRYYSDITPSNATPVALGSGDIIKSGGAGYAIASYDSKTPSDSTPPSVASGDIVKVGGAGYLYETEFPDFGLEPDVTYQNLSAGSSGTVSITVTRKPRYIIAAANGRNSNYSVSLLIVDVTNSKCWRLGCEGSTPVNTDFSSSISTVFPTISETSVVYNYAWWAANHRINIDIYY